MPFQKEYLNLGGGMNLTSGVFTAPKAGIYTFIFRGTGYYLAPTVFGYGFVYLQRNGVDVAIGDSMINGGNLSNAVYLNLSVRVTLRPNIGDTVTIRLYKGTIYSNDKHIQFTGSLLEEDLVIS